MNELIPSQTDRLFDRVDSAALIHMRGDVKGDICGDGRCVWSAGAEGKVVKTHLSSLQLPGCAEGEQVWTWASVHVNVPTTWTMFDSSSQLGLFEQAGPVRQWPIILGWSHAGRSSLLCGNVKFYVLRIINTTVTEHWSWAEDQWGWRGGGAGGGLPAVWDKIKHCCFSSDPPYLKCLKSNRLTANGHELCCHTSWLSYWWENPCAHARVRA